MSTGMSAVSADPCLHSSCTHNAQKALKTQTCYFWGLYSFLHSSCTHPCTHRKIVQRREEHFFYSVEPPVTLIQPGTSPGSKNAPAGACCLTADSEPLSGHAA